MPSSGMLSHVALQRSDISGERIAFNTYTVFLRSMLRLLVTANVPGSPILVTLMMETMHSSETAVLTIATRRNIPEDGILQRMWLYILPADLVLCFITTEVVLNFKYSRF
jgi:hypothetical protein